MKLLTTATLFAATATSALAHSGHGGGAAGHHAGEFAALAIAVVVGAVLLLRRA